MTRFDFVEPILILCIVAGISLFAFEAVMAFRHGPSKCFRGEVRRVHHNSWVQIVATGKTTFPIYHNAYDSNEWVCLQHKENE